MAESERGTLALSTVVRPVRVAPKPVRVVLRAQRASAERVLGNPGEMLDLTQARVVAKQSMGFLANRLRQGVVAAQFLQERARLHQGAASFIGGGHVDSPWQP